MSEPGAVNHCPLCTAPQAELLTKLDPEVLRSAYRREFDVEIRLPDIDRIDYLRCRQCDLRFFLPAVAGDAGFYRQLQRIPWYYMEQKAEYDIAARYIGAGDSILEVGAGRGVFARHARCAAYRGLETSPDAIAAAAREGIELLQEDLEAHSERHAGQYDAVCAFQVLEHVPDPRSFLQSAHRCLRERGKLIVAVPSEDSFARIAFWDILNMPPHHITRWSDRCLRNAAELFNLRVSAIEHEPLDERHVRLYARLVAEYGLARRRGYEPTLLDPRMRSWYIRRGSKLAASSLRRALQDEALRPVGHSVVAVFEKC